MQNLIKYTKWFKSYKHFHLLLTDGRTDSHSDYSADPRVVQFDPNDTCGSRGTKFSLTDNNRLD